MSDDHTDPANHGQPPYDPRIQDPGTDVQHAPDARVHKRRFSMVWLIPILAGLIAAWLGWHTLSQRGPVITISFSTGDGLTADQTQVKYKSVQLGTVDSVRLSHDMSHVDVRIRMRAEAEDRLTNNARFWVVRPRISSGNISGLETLVSGAYIAMDPGQPGGDERREFKGLENPPGVRSDEPGSTYTLMADTIGGIGQGSPVFYRDMAVGEVLGYDPPALHGKIKVHVFVRAPYDKYVRDDSRFWDTSGVQVNVGAGGIRVQLESLQAVLSGGIAFATPKESRDEPPTGAEAEFTLYKDYDAAVAATSQNRIRMRTYLSGSVRGLSNGAAVELDGVRIGSVTETHLEYDPVSHDFRVPVNMAIEPDLIAFNTGSTPDDMRQILIDRIRRGMHAELQTSSYLTGAMVVELVIPPDPKPTEPKMDGDTVLIAGETGGFGNIVTSLSNIATKLDKIPFDQIGNNLNDTLANASALVASPDVKNAVRDLSATLASVRHLVRKTDAGLSPVMDQLPTLETNLDTTLRHANDLLGREGYGGDSQFHRDVERLMNQANDTLRSVRALVDLLDRHPEALIRGRTGAASR